MRFPKLEIIKRNYNTAPHRDRSTSIVDDFKDKLNAKDLTHIPNKINLEVKYTIVRVHVCVWC